MLWIVMIIPDNYQESFAKDLDTHAPLMVKFKANLKEKRSKITLKINSVVIHKINALFYLATWSSVNPLKTSLFS